MQNFLFSQDNASSPDVKDHFRPHRCAVTPEAFRGLQDLICHWQAGAAVTGNVCCLRHYPVDIFLKLCQERADRTEQPKWGPPVCAYLAKNRLALDWRSFVSGAEDRRGFYSPAGNCIREIQGSYPSVSWGQSNLKPEAENSVWKFWKRYTPVRELFQGRFKGEKKRNFILRCWYQIIQTGKCPGLCIVHRALKRWHWFCRVQC